MREFNPVFLVDEDAISYHAELAAESDVARKRLYGLAMEYLVDDEDFREVVFEAAEDAPSRTCAGTKVNGDPCSVPVADGGYCGTHADQAEE